MMMSIGDLARGLALQRQTGALKRDVQRLTAELASGRTADPARRVGADVSIIAGLDNALARLAGTRAALAEADRTTAAMQGALASLGTAAEGVFGQIASLGPDPGENAVARAAQEASDRFVAALGAINARDAGRALFAGAALDGAAVTDAASIFAAVQAAVALSGATTAEGIADAVADWFDAPAGYAASAYLGSDVPRGPLPAGAGGPISLDLDARDPAFRRTLAGLAMAALAGAPPAAGATGAALLTRAATALAEAAASRADAAGRLGRIEARIAEATGASAAEANTLDIARAQLLEADPFATATALEAAQRQIETLYAVTARVSRLSLADFLR
ncbi:MAG: flagellin [Gemmobacter sp.]